MRVAALQHDIVWEDRDANLARLAPMIDRSAGDGADLIACTEMFSVGFSMNTAAVAEPVDGPSTTFLVERAAATGAWVCGSVPELRPGHERPVNCLVLAGPDGTVHRYAKIHRFGYAGEDEHYDAGGTTVTVEIAGVRLSLFVCFDLRFAPDFWRVAPATDAYLVVANWPAARRHHWMSLLTARAIENQAWVIGVNRVGDADGLAHSGDSRIVDPLGETIAAGAEGVEETIVADVDPAMVADVRARFPFLAARTD